MTGIRWTVEELAEYQRKAKNPGRGGQNKGADIPKPPAPVKTQPQAPKKPARRRFRGVDIDAVHKGRP